MKKIVLLFTAFTLLIFSSVSYATIPPIQLALGGIYLGDSVDKVYSVYGNPRTKRNNGTIIEYDYGNGLLITFWDEAQSKDVVEIKVTEHNGFATPAGLEVGTHVDALYKLYGKADFHNARNVVHYLKYCNTENQNQYLLFTVCEDKITEIVLHWSV